MIVATDSKETNWDQANTLELCKTWVAKEASEQDNTVNYIVFKEDAYCRGLSTCSEVSIGPTTICEIPEYYK